MSAMPVLPERDEAPRCTDFTRSLQVDPGGSAIRADLLIAAEMSLPWPRPITAHEFATGLDTAMAEAPQPTRVLAAVPRGEDLEVVTFRRRDEGADRTVWRTDAHHVRETVLSLIIGREPGDADLVTTAQAAEVWVCTQGSHDVCCGADGTKLVVELEGMLADAIVRRVSHTGGHRFAPTAITLPDGRMWAHLEPEDVQSILGRGNNLAELAPKCRGWWGAEAGWEQVAERWLFQSRGWAWDDTARSVGVTAVDGNIASVRVRLNEGAEQSWIVRVRVARNVPRISCRAPGGLPAKPGFEYAVVDARREPI